MTDDTLPIGEAATDGAREDDGASTNRPGAAGPDQLALELAALWDADASTYDARPRHGIRFPDERQAWRRLVAAMLGDPSHSAMPRLRVLDVGTGTGVLALLAAELGHDVTGIDLSAGMLAQARRRALDAGLAVTWLSGDATAPPVEPASFDAILCRHLVSTLPNPGAAFAAWRVAVRPAGLVAIIDGWYVRRRFTSRLVQRFAATLADGRSGSAGSTGRRYSDEQLARMPLMHQDGFAAVAAAMRSAGLERVRVRALPEVDRVERAHLGTLDRLADPWRRYLATGRRPADR